VYSQTLPDILRDHSAKADGQCERIALLLPLAERLTGKEHDQEPQEQKHDHYETIDEPHQSSWVAEGGMLTESQAVFDKATPFVLLGSDVPEQA
jgi:hypothetical protein